MPLWHTAPGCLARFRRRSSLDINGHTCRAFIDSYRHKYRYIHNNPHTAELQAKKADFLRLSAFKLEYRPVQSCRRFCVLFTFCAFQKFIKHFDFLLFHVIILHIFINLTFPAVFPCAICFYLEMHKLQQCKDDCFGVPCLEPFACNTCRRYKRNY